MYFAGEENPRNVSHMNHLIGKGVSNTYMYKATAKGACEETIYSGDRPVWNTNKYFPFEGSSAAELQFSYLTDWWAPHWIFGDTTNKLNISMRFITGIAGLHIGDIACHIYPNQARWQYVERYYEFLEDKTSICNTQ
jgi:hypothetical protein